MLDIKFKNQSGFSLLERKIRFYFEEFMMKSGLEQADIDITIDYEQRSYLMGLSYNGKIFKKNSYNPMHAAKEIKDSLTKSLKKEGILKTN